MDLMEFFKNLFGDKVLTYEEIKKTIDSAENVKVNSLVELALTTAGAKNMTAAEPKSRDI